MAALTAWSGAASASPYKITGLGATTSLEFKLFTKFKSTASKSALKGPGFDLTAPIVHGLEASFTTGPGRLPEDGKTRWGMMDSEAAMKWVPIPEDGGIGVTTEPTLVSPNGLNDGDWRFEAPLVVGWGR
jgi:hypothetical protein